MDLKINAHFVPLMIIHSLAFVSLLIGAQNRYVTLSKLEGRDCVDLSGVAVHQYGNASST